MSRGDLMVYEEGQSRGVWTAGLLLALIGGMLAAGGYWAYASQMDEITRAPASLIPTSRLQTVQAVDGGIVKKMLVREGQQVEKGELLVQLDSGRPQAVVGESAAKVAALTAAIARTRAELSNTALIFPASVASYSEITSAQRIMFDRRLQSLKEEISVLERGMSLADNELKLNLPLAKTGEVSQVEIIRLERQVNDIRSQIAIRNNRYVTEAQGELAKAQDELAAASQVLVGRKDQVQQADITSPMRGIVKNVRFTTIGGVVRAAEEILQIVPLEEELLVEAKIRPVDIGFLKPGLETIVKLDAYDYSIYGAMKGKLTYISPDTLREESAKDDVRYYRATITITDATLRSPRGEKTEVIPGMTATVEIKTGQKTVMQYLLKPFNKTLSEALTEK